MPRPDEDAPADPAPSAPAAAGQPPLRATHAARRRPPGPSMPSLGAPDEEDPGVTPAAPVAAVTLTEPPTALPPAPLSESDTGLSAPNPVAPVSLEAPSVPEEAAPPPEGQGGEAPPQLPPTDGMDEATASVTFVEPPAAELPILELPAPTVSPAPLPVRRAVHAAPPPPPAAPATAAPPSPAVELNAPAVPPPLAPSPVPAPTARPALEPEHSRFAWPTLPTTGVAGLAVWAVRAVLVAAGIGLGVLGQNTLDTARLTNSGAPPQLALQQWALGALLLAIGAWPAPLLRTAVPAARRVLWSTNPRRRLAAGLGAAALLFGLAGLPLFAQINSPPDNIPLTGGIPNGAWALYLVSLLLLGLALVVWESGAKGGSLADSADPAPDQLRRWIEVAVLVGLFALGLVFRVGNLDSAPPGLWFDEAQNGIVARNIVGLDAPHPVFIVDRTQMGALYFYVLGMALAVTGTKIATLRLLPALAGALMAPLLYLLASRLYGWRAGLAAGGLITVAIWSITFSRFGLVTNISVLLDLATLTFLVLALRSGRLGWYGLAGITFGLNLHMYYVARLMPLVIALVFTHKLLSERTRFLRGVRFGVLVFAAAALIAFLPMGLYALQHTTEFMGRISDVSVFNPSANGGDPLAFQHSLEKHLWMFNWEGDGNARHNLPGAPMLDSIIGALFVLGVGYCLLRAVRWQFFFPLAWFSVEILGGVLSLPFEAPQANRTAENMLTTVLFAGLVLGLGAAAIFRSRALAALPVPDAADDSRAAPGRIAPVPLPGRSRLLLRAGQVLAAGLVLAVVAQVGQIAQARYFSDQVNSTATWREMYVPEMTVARIMQDYGSNYDIYIVPVYNGLPPQLFLAKDNPAPLEYPGEWAIPLGDAMNRNIAFVIDPPTAGDFARLTRLYPKATFNILHAPNSSEPIQYTAFITKEDLQSIHGVHVRFFAADAPPTAAPLSERDLPSINQSWGGNADDPKLPFRVRYEATLRLQSSGMIRLHLDGDPPGSIVQVDGFAMDTPRLLGAGLHTLRVEATVRAANMSLRLVMAQDEVKDIEVAPSMLFKPSVEPHGLTGYYRRGDIFEGDATKVRIDPVLSFYFHETPLDRPYTIEWKGKLFIPQEGMYELGLEQISRSSLEIDGKQVINNPTDNSYQQAQLQLSRGLHDIRVRFEDVANYSHLYLYWTPPGHDRSIIPSYFFWPEMANYPDPAAAGGTWPTLDDADGRVLPRGFTGQAPVPAITPQPGQTLISKPTEPPAAPPAQQPPAQQPPPATPPANLHLPPIEQVKPTRQLALDGKSDPRGIATDGAGNLYVVTGTEAKVHKVDPAGKEIASWALQGKDGTPPVEPFSLAIVGEQLIVLDAATSDLLRYDLAGQAKGVVHACECFFPRGLLAESDGTLWLADTGGGRLVHISADAQALGVLGTRGSNPGQFVEPTSLWRAPDGTLFVADVGNNRIQHLAADGTFQAQWPIAASIARDGARLSGDAAGHVYVSFPEAGVVVAYDATGKPLATWQPTDPPLRPSSLAVRDSTLFVAYPFDGQVVGVPTLP